MEIIIIITTIITVPSIIIISCCYIIRSFRVLQIVVIVVAGVEMIGMTNSG